MSVFSLLVNVHALAATVWTGGHLVLDLGVLPKALRERDAAAIRAFEETFEPLGLSALAIQVVSGLWLVGIVCRAFAASSIQTTPWGCWPARSCCCWPPPLPWRSTPACA